MFKKFAIKVTSRFIAAPEANTQEEYVIEYKAKRDFLRRSNSPRATWSTAAEAEAVIEELPVRRAGAFPQKHSYEIEEINYTHANQNGYSDTTPFEIVRVVSNKTIELRSPCAHRHSLFTCHLSSIEAALFWFIVVFFTSFCSHLWPRRIFIFKFFVASFAAAKQLLNAHPIRFAAVARRLQCPFHGRHRLLVGCCVPRFNDGHLRPWPHPPLS